MVIIMIGVKYASRAILLEALRIAHKSGDKILTRYIQYIKEDMFQILAHFVNWGESYDPQKMDYFIFLKTITFSFL